MKNKKISEGNAVPWLWLQLDEDNCEAEKCACQLVRDYNNGGPAFFFCPTHAAAPEMFEALKKIAAMATPTPNQLVRGKLDDCIKIAITAIAKSKGE
jgi:hypothetical protein